MPYKKGLLALQIESRAGLVSSDVILSKSIHFVFGFIV